MSKELNKLEELQLKHEVSTDSKYYGSYKSKLNEVAITLLTKELGFENISKSIISHSKLLSFRKFIGLPYEKLILELTIDPEESGWWYKLTQKIQFEHSTSLLCETHEFTNVLSMIQHAEETVEILLKDKQGGVK